MASPLWLTLTLTLAGVVAVFGVTESQLPPTADAVAVNRAAPVPLVTCTSWSTGTPPLVRAVKLNDVAELLIGGGLVTVNTTGIVTEPLAAEPWATSDPL